MATIAFAATVSGDGTLVGSTGNDTITAGNGDDTIWGLGGTDVITAGKGNDTIDGNGHCQGAQPGDYPKGLPKTDYCEHGAIAGSNNGDTITVAAGMGNDVVYGGGGFNTITLANGNDTVFGGLVGNKITVGAGDDTIYAGGGPDTITTGTGQGGPIGTIHAQNGQVDHITCATPNFYTVYADKSDVVTGCKTVKFTTASKKSHTGARTHKKHAAKRKHTAHHRSA
jgi:Ca2+-binding RTX toxin-like protein